jgi:hypothetical protein
LPRTNTKWVFGKAQSNATFDAIVEGVAIEFMKSLGCKGDIFELNEAHWTILFGSET